MSFKDMMKNDLKDVVLNTDEFAQAVVYTPSGGTARTINVVLTFKPLEPIDEDFGRALHHTAEMDALNDATDGIDEVSVSGDRITLTDDTGTSRTARILRVISSDDASKKLLIGW